MWLTHSTPCAVQVEPRPLRAKPWRVVEAQHRVATRKLSASDDAQRVLEDLLERYKPKVPAAAEHLHYLLKTPFRYPPLRHGSRFGAWTERGIWYGARSQTTALAESSHYLRRFVSESAAQLLPLTVERSLFQAALRTSRALRLTEPPLSDFEALWRHPTDYAATQRLGREVRGAVDVMVYASVRDARAGSCFAVLEPAAFAETQPLAAAQTWQACVSASRIEWRRATVAPRPIVFEG